MATDTASAFSDPFTASYGGRCFFVAVDSSLDHHIADAASLLARSRPESDRAAWVQGLVERATSAADSADAQRAVVADLVRALPESPLEAHSDRELEGFTHLVLSLVLAHFQPTDPDYPELVSALAAALAAPAPAPAPTSANSTNKVSLAVRYAALATVFNALPATGAEDLRLTLLLQLVGFAAANDDLAVVAPALAQLPLWLQNWKLGPARAHAAVAEIVRHLVSGGHSRQARELLTAHLSAPSAAADADAESEAAGQLATTLVALSLAAPDVFDLPALIPARFPALAHLPAPLAELLALFQSSPSSPSPSTTLPSIPQAALTASPDVPLSAPQLEHKLRLVQLADLCAHRVGSTVRYDEIAKACGVDATAGSEEESELVEGWVMDAIRASLVLGRLSQPTRTFSVARASPVQAFTPQHWITVQQSLRGWKASLGRMRGSVDKALNATTVESVGAGARRVGEEQALQQVEQEQ